MKKHHLSSTRSTRRQRFAVDSEQRNLRSYFSVINEWLGFARFVGLPRLRENPDIPIEELFVEPRLAKRQIDSDRPQNEWDTSTSPALDTIAECPRLVVLGDPGTGKSTLVSYIAWRLTHPEEDAWTAELGRQIPLPFILRELSLDRTVTWESLLENFIKHPIGRPLGSPAQVEAILSRGQGFLILDGLDEVGDAVIRRALRGAVWSGWSRYPANHWLLTSRVVGYEDVPFDRALTEHEIAPEVIGLNQEGDITLFLEELRASVSAVGEAFAFAEVRYLAPFTDEQIRQFAFNWYAQREASREHRTQGAQNLVASVQANPNTHRLARVPNLLAMMALIHRVKARLPYGRALLYTEIAQAYLETIDEFRGFRALGYSLEQKKLWLAYVGFQMQLRRSRPSETSDAPVDQILAGEEEVIAWVVEAMADSGQSRDENAAQDFIDYVARRSGLLLPRAPSSEGGNRFAFMHLSFQEYFAALYLASQVKLPRWIDGRASSPGPTLDDLRYYSRKQEWRETMVLVFELLAAERGWSHELAIQLFGEEFRTLAPHDVGIRQLVRLASELSVDPHSGFDEAMRKEAFDQCCRWEVTYQSRTGIVSPQVSKRSEVFHLLLAGDVEQPEGLERIITVTEEQQAVCVNLAGIAVKQIAAIARLHLLRSLNLDDTLVEDLAPLGRLKNLEELSMRGTQVRDLSPLMSLQKLRTIIMSDSSIRDLSSLRVLKHLGILDFTGTDVAVIEPLARLTKLWWLMFDDTPVEDLGPLARLSMLRVLSINQTNVDSLAPLSRLVGIKALLVKDAKIHDLGPIANLKKLVILNIAGTQVEDLSALATLDHLEILNIDKTPVQDLSPLYRLPKLVTLYLGATHASPEAIAELRRVLPRLEVLI